jgi:N6-L-threonylcarbamoyladenine synthase
MIILGIETSCDETGIALYDRKNKKIIFEALYSQADQHSLYGGVVPELAARDHVNRLLPLLKRKISSNKFKLKDIDAIAYTKGPGLRGPLMVGTAFSKALAFSLDIPTFPIHHMEAHLIMAKFDAPKLTYPFISLLVSGGHSLLAKVKSPGNYQIIGESIDDAVGEAFDKTAKLLGLKYPGGPEIERVSKQGNLTQLIFPRPMLKSKNLNFSFSGLKTAVLYEVRRQQEADSLDQQKIADIALAFQEAAIECLVEKSIKAMYQEECNQLVLSGGVAANLSLRNSFKNKLTESQSIFYPDMSHCTDNGVMIAFAGAEKLHFQNEGHKIEVNPRWSLEALNER